jgi:hypothetical protein
MTVQYLCGVPIKVSSDPLRYGPLPSDLPLPPAFRAEFNAWCESFFSRMPEWNLVKDGQCYKVTDVFSGGKEMLVMNPRTLEQLKKAAQ